jgi:hypothetical protein
VLRSEVVHSSDTRSRPCEMHMLHRGIKVRKCHCQWPRGKGVNDSLSSSRGGKIGGRDVSMYLRDEGDCGCMRKDS